MGSNGREEPGRLLLLAPLMPIPLDLAELLPVVSRWFPRPSRIETMRVDLQVAFSTDRGQYHSSRLLLELKDRLRPEVDRLVGVVDVDLYIPVLTHVFGEAQLGGPLAVVSTFRLREPWLSQGAPPEQARSRVLKTILHELGHTAGLRHCSDYTCIMTSAASLEMLDEKSEEFCLECRGRILRSLR